MTYHDNILPPPDNEAEWQQWGPCSPCFQYTPDLTRRDINIGNLSSDLMMRIMYNSL